MEYGVSLMVNASPIGPGRSDEHLWSTMGLMGEGPSVRAKSGSRVNSKTAMGYPPLYRAINLIASSVAGLPFDVFRRQRGGGKKVDNRHPAQLLLDKKASSYMNAYTFRRTMTALALLHGNSFASIDRVEGRPDSLAIWNPQNTMVRAYEGRIWYITYVGSEIVRVPAENMLHIRGLGPDGIVGYPILELMADALGVGMAAMEFGARFFGQGSNMSGLLMIPGHFSEEKIRNTMQAWNSMQSGLQQSHKVALLQDGVKFQQLQISPDQAQFLETREHEVRATVANITGVPPHMLGDATRTSFSSLEAEGQSYLDYTLQPWLKVWEAECEDKLLTQQQIETDSHLIEFNREALVQMTFDSKINGIYRQLEAGLITHNEGRSFLNMQQLGPDGDKRYRPANWMEIGSMEEQTQTTQPDTGTQVAALVAMVTSSVTKAVDLEQSKAIRLANSAAATFLPSVDEFYDTWTENSLPGLVDQGVRKLIENHANESRRQLFDVAGCSTTENLKANVAQLVVTWDDRRESLISSILKAVQ